MADTAVLEGKIAKKEGELGKLKAQLQKAQRVNIKSLQITEAMQRVVKSGRHAFKGHARDPKSGIIYQISAVAVPVKSEPQS